MKHHVTNALVIAATLFALLFLANLLVDNPYTHRFIKAALNRTIREHSNLRISFEAMNVNVLPLRLDLYGLKITSALDRKELVRASYLKTTVSIWSLLIDRPKLSLIQLDNLTLVWPPVGDITNLLRQKDTLDSDEKARDSKPGIFWPPPNLPINSIQLTNSKIYVQTDSPINLSKDVDVQLALAMTGVNIEIDLEKGRHSRVKWSIEHVNLDENDRSIIENANFNGEINQHERHFITRSLVLKSDRLNIDGRLELDVKTNTDRRIVSVDASSTAALEGDLSTIGSILDLDATSGHASADVNVDLLIPLVPEIESQFKLSGQTKVSDGLFADFRLFDTDIDIDIDFDKISFSSGTMSYNDNKLASIDGFITFNQSLDFGFFGKTENLPLSNVMSALGSHFELIDLSFINTPIAIKGQGFPFHMTIEGDGTIEKVTVPVLNDRPRLADHLPCHGPVHLDVNKQRLKFVETKIHCPVGEVEQEGSIEIKAPHESFIDISGAINFDTETIDLTLDIPEIDGAFLTALSHLNIGGHGHADVHVHGPFTDVNTEILIGMNDASVAMIELGEVNGQLHFRNGRLYWREITARDQTETIDIHLSKGHYQFDHGAFTSQIATRAISSKAIAKITNLLEFPEFVFGVNNISGTISGLIDHLGDSQVDADITLSDFRNGSEHYFDSTKMHVYRKKDQFRLTEVQVQRGDLSINADLDIPTSKNKNLKISSHPILKFLGLSDEQPVQISLTSQASGTGNELQSLPVIGSYLKNPDINGDIQANVKLSGPLNQLQGTLEGQIANASILGADAPPLKLLGFLVDKKLDLTFTHGGNALEGRLKVDLLTDSLPYEWFININHFDMRSVWGKKFYDDPRNYSYLEGNWHMKGNLTEWKQSRGQLLINKVQWKYVHEQSSQTKNIHLMNRDPVTLLFSDKGWIFADQRELELISEHIYTTVSLPPINHPDDLSINISSEIRLAILSNLFKNVESSTGKLRLDTKVTGPINDLKLEVASHSLPESATDELISISVSDMRPRFSDIKYQLNYQDGILNVHHLSARKGGGTLHSSGLLNIAGPETIDSNLFLNFKDIKLDYYLPYLKKFDTVLDGDLAITGAKIPYRMTGDIKVVKARSSRQFDIREEVVNALRRDSISSISTTQANNPLLLLDIAIKGDNSIVIQNKDLNLNVSNDLKIGGTPEKPSLIGNILINKGTINYRRDFNILRGEITFDDPVRIDPKIDILAATEVSVYRVSISATGTASQPIVELLVDPPTRDDGSIISRLDAIILLSRGSLPDIDQQTAQSQGVGVSELLTIYSSQLPIEQIFEAYSQSFQPYLDWTTDEKGSPVAQLNVRFNIVEGIGGVYSRGPKQSKVSLEIPIHEGISSSLNQTFISGENDEAASKNEGSFDLRFRFSFN